MKKRVPLFQLASYNILADSYINPVWYPSSTIEMLRWEQRKVLLGKKVAEFAVDIICLQEVEEAAFQLLMEILSKQNYQGVYRQKGTGKPDGCAAFYKHGSLQFQDCQTIYYQDRAKGERDSGHLAQVLSFSSEIGRIGIANTHLKWDRRDRAKERHIGYQQVQELLAFIKQDTITAAWVICGDLNAQPDSPIITELLDQGFKDAYQRRGQATCNPNRKAKRLDYIFHTDNLTTTPGKLLRIGNFTALPSETEPSDHLPIMASFSIK